MSKLQGLLAENVTSFTIPVLSSLRYSTISKRDKALCVVLREGYLESKSVHAMVTLRLYFLRTGNLGFKLIGKIDGVKLKDGTVVFRQRLHFLSLLKLLQFLKRYNVGLNVLSSFKIENKHRRFLGKEIDCIKSICPLLDAELWIRNTTFIQLAFICNIMNISLRLPVELDDICSKGVLDKALYICGSITSNDKSSSILVVPLEYFKEKNLMLLLNKHDGYSVKYKGKSVHLNGYTRRNLRFYKRRGKMSNGYRRENTGK